MRHLPLVHGQAMLRLQQAQDTRTKRCHHRIRKLSKTRDCDINEATIAEAVLYSEEFKEIQIKVDDSEMPASKKQISDSAPAFKAAIETKPVQLVVGDASKTIAIGTNLDPNR